MDSSLGRPRRTTRVVALAAAALAVLGGCDASQAPASGRPDDHVVIVSLSDFKVKLSADVIPAGEIRFRLANAGPTVHEFVIARTLADADHLPIAEDGLSADEDASMMHEIGEVESVELGANEDYRARLRPGHYVLYCNLPGHYMGGMHVDLTVIP